MPRCGLCWQAECARFTVSQRQSPHIGKPKAIKPVVGYSHVRPASLGPGALHCPAGLFKAGVAILVSSGRQPQAFREVAISLFQFAAKAARLLL